MPRLLADKEKEHMVCGSGAFSGYDEEGDTFLDRILTTDETWLYQFYPETNSQSVVWNIP